MPKSKMGRGGSKWAMVAWIALATGLGPGLFVAPAEAQEIRLSGSQGYSGTDEVRFPRGFGGGVRAFLPRGIGVGLDLDRLRSSPTITALTCPPGGEGSAECSEERVALDTELELLTLLVMLGGQGEDWGLRVGLGRSAGVVTARGVGLETGREIAATPADEGAGLLAWRRGSDGSVLLIELLRRLPVPGPFPVSALASYRYHHTDMGGCLVGEYSPFCGPHSLTELQLGLNLGLLPRR